MQLLRKLGSSVWNSARDIIWFLVMRGPVTTLFVLAFLVLCYFYWDQLREGASLSETLRNLALVIAAIVALPLAVRRLIVAEYQSETAQRGLLNERYQKGAEMLGSEVLSVRLGGIYALRRLAEEHPKDYHLHIMQLFCAFVRNPPAAVATAHSREDIKDIMEAISIHNRNEGQLALEHQVDYHLDLHGADLRHQYLHEMNLSRVQLTRARLSGAFLARAILSGAECFETDLSDAKLPGANLSGASFTSANLSSVQATGADFSNASLYNANLTDADLSGAALNGVDFTGANLAGAIFYKDGVLAEGLTQRQIAFAKAMPEDRPPRLDGLIDPETNKLIEWNKRPRIIK